MKNLKLAAISILFAGISIQAQAGPAKEEAGFGYQLLPKNCHAVNPTSYENCQDRQRSGFKINCNAEGHTIVCDKVETKEELLARIEAQEGNKIFSCLQSVATNKKSMGIVPVGSEGEKKFEILNNSLTADQSKKEHLLVNAATNSVQNCKFDGENKVCSRASWSDLKRIMAENINLSKADPFKPVKEKFVKKHQKLTGTKSDLETKENFVQRMAESNGEGIKKHLDSLEQLNPEEAKEQKRRWKKIFAAKLGVSEAEFSNVDKLRAIKKEKIAEALKEIKEATKKKIADLPQDEVLDKQLYKEKMERVAESSKDGQKLCQDIGLESLVSEIKKKGQSSQGSSRLVTTTTDK